MVVGDGMVIFGVAWATDLRNLKSSMKMPLGRRKLAGNLQRRRRMVARTGSRVKAHGEFSGDLPYIVELQQEIALPECAIVFAVGDEA